jgi:glycosyltransferase involved in cell wall biosynthesis
MSVPVPPSELGKRARSVNLAVLIPVFNAQRGLEQSLSSLRHEDAGFEVFVVDDGSETILTVPEGLPFPVHLHRLDRNGGITKALNAGLDQIAAAGFPYVARLDAGDLSLPGRFAAQIAFLERHPNHAVVGTYVEIVDEQGRLLYYFTPPTDHRSLVRRLHYENPFSHPSVTLRMAALQTDGTYTEMYTGGEDYELWLRLSRNWKLANIDRIFVRKSEASTSITSRRLRLGISRLRLQIDHFTPRSIHAYLGITRSVLALFLSRKTVFGVRRLKTRLTEGRTKP